MNVSICIATFGDERWRDLAMSRAYPSALEQDAPEIIVVHQPVGTLASARNAAAAQAHGDWLCFLDADDELASGYLDAMMAASVSALSDRYEDFLFAPSCQFVNGRRMHRVQTPSQLKWRADQADEMLYHRFAHGSRPLLRVHSLRRWL